MAAQSGLVIDKSSVSKVMANLRLIAGNASKIVGTMQELMSYAANVELGIGRNKSKPHMRPAYAEMLAKYVPKAAAYIKREMHGRPQDIDRVVQEAVYMALSEMERIRVEKLRALVYTAEKLAAQREKGYRGYKLTGNLMNNRQIMVKAVGAAITSIKKGAGDLGKAVQS